MSLVKSILIRSLISKRIPAILQNHNFTSSIKGRTPVILQRKSNFDVWKHWCSTKISSDSANIVEIYYGSLTPQIKGVKIFSLLTSAAGIVAQPILYQHMTTFGGGMPLTIALGSVIGFFTFITPFLLHMLLKKYVTKIDYFPKEDKYSVTTLTFFLRPRTVEFVPEDVDIPDIPGMFTSFHIKGKPMLVDPRLFADSNHYAKIMGYDKPLDFKLGNIVESSTDPKKK